MAPRSTGYFAGFDLENGENVRRLVVGINAVARSKAFSPLLTDRQRISIQLLIQAMVTSPLIDTIIRTQLVKLGPFAPEAALIKAGRLLDSYIVASAATPGTAAYVDAQRAWETRQPLQASINLHANTNARPPIQPQLRGQVIDDDDDDDDENESEVDEESNEESLNIKAPRSYRVRHSSHTTIGSNNDSAQYQFEEEEMEGVEATRIVAARERSRNVNTTGEQSSFSAANSWPPQEYCGNPYPSKTSSTSKPGRQAAQIESDRQIALELAAMEAADNGVNPKDSEKVVEAQMGAQVSVVHRRAVPVTSSKAPSNIHATEPIQIPSKDASKMLKKPGDRSAGPGSKQPWLQSEKALVLELLTEHSKKYRQPKFSRLTNAYNDRMSHSGVKQGKGEKLLSAGKHKTLGCERVAPWRTKAALMKVAKTWPEYATITGSALPTYDLSTQTETDPLTGVPGADDASDDEEYPPPALTDDASAYPPRGRKTRKWPVNSDDEDENREEAPKKKRKAPLRAPRNVKKQPPRTDDDVEDGDAGHTA